MNEFDYSKCAVGIKLHRLERGLSIRELADLAGIDYTYLTNIESGEKHPSAQTLILILNALIIDVSDCIESPRTDSSRTFYLKKLKIIFKHLNKDELDYMSNVITNIKNLKETGNEL